MFGLTTYIPLKTLNLHKYQVKSQNYLQSENLDLAILP